MESAEPAGSSPIGRHGTVDGLRSSDGAAVRHADRTPIDAIKEVARATTARGASPVRRALNIAPIMRPPSAADSRPPAPSAGSSLIGIDAAADCA